MELLSYTSLAMAAGAATVAGVIDVRSFRVPNVLTVPVLAAGLAFHGITSGWAGIQSSLLGATCGFGILMIFFVMGVMGAGDVKLMAAIGAWLGLPATLTVFLLAATINAVYSVCVLFLQGGPRRVAIAFQIMWMQFATMGRFVGEEERIEAVVNKAEHRSRMVPFAAMIALGVSSFAVWQLMSSNVLAVQ